MAWITPKTDRKDAESRTTATDLTRICANLADLGYGTGLMFTDDHIVTIAEWQTIIAQAMALNTKADIDYSTSWQNLNAIERACELKKNNKQYDGYILSFALGSEPRTI